MSHVSSFLAVMLVMISLAGSAQRKWDGGGGNNLWSNALNWVGNTVPSTSDEVVLDNSIISSNFTIVLPSTSVSVKRITISPISGRRIELTLPSSNTLSPGLSISGPGYGMILNTGGVFRNSSGSTSGIAVVVADSIQVNNGAEYIHNTRSGHSSNVQVLSGAPGTETGVFVLDIPSASSTISLSGRTFGTLQLRSAAAGGSCNYTAAGTSRINVMGNLDLGAGVTLNLNCSDTIFVGGNFIQGAGTFNLGNSSRSVSLKVSQNFTQATGGVITETGTGIHSIVMAGSGIQLMTTRGSWLNQVAFVKAGTAAVLMKSALSLPYQLALLSGAIITSDTWLITLQANCTIYADSLSQSGHISGPLQKEGLNNTSFLFPVGDLSTMRWIRLENATGNFTVSYKKSDPGVLSNAMGSGIDHISGIEYWSISGTTGASAKVKLSFNDPHSGGVTDLSSLRVARLSSGVWQNAGVSSYSGSPGLNGWVSSTTAGGFSADESSFALASAIGQENPLPFIQLSFDAQLFEKKLTFTWESLGMEPQPAEFEIQSSDDGLRFYTFKQISAGKCSKFCKAEFQNEKISKYYRLRMRYVDSDHWYESSVRSLQTRALNEIGFPAGNTFNDKISVLFNFQQAQTIISELMDMSGKRCAGKKVFVAAGITRFDLDASGLQTGIYILVIRTSSGKTATYRLLKRERG